MVEIGHAFRMHCFFYDFPQCGRDESRPYGSVGMYSAEKMLPSVRTDCDEVYASVVIMPSGSKRMPVIHTILLF